MDNRIFLISLAFIFMFSSTAFANGGPDATGAATTYKVTLSTFEIDNGAGSTSVTAFSGTSSTLDIASAQDTNTSVGNFMSGLVVPDGTYSRVKPTPSGTFTVAGSVTEGVTTYITRSATGSGGGCLTKTSGTVEECTITINVGAQDWQNLPGSIVVSDGKPNYRVRVKFNTSVALGLYTVGGDLHREIFPQQPQVSVSLVAQ